MEITRLKLILGSVLVGVALFVGCGGGDPSGGTTSGDGSTTTSGATTTGANGGQQGSSGSKGASKPLTKSEFTTRTSEICIQVPPSYQSKLKELEKKEGKKLSKAESNLKAAIPPLETTISSMEELVPPQGDEETVEAILDALKAGVQTLEEEPLSKLSGAESPFAKFQKLAKEYGLATCGGL
jgi:hypothetical protein